MSSIYIGQTGDFKRRLKQHNSGQSKSTHKTNDWVPILTENYPTRGDAVNREKQLKSSQGRAFIWSLIEKKHR